MSEQVSSFSDTILDFAAARFIFGTHPIVSQMAAEMAAGSPGRNPARSRPAPRRSERRLSAAPVSRYAAQLRQPAAETGRAHEADSGLAGSQRYFHHGQHLRPPGLPVQAAQRRHDRTGAGAAGGVAPKPVVNSQKETPGASPWGSGGASEI